MMQVKIKIKINNKNINVNKKISTLPRANNYIFSVDKKFCHLTISQFHKPSFIKGENFMNARAKGLVLGLGVAAVLGVLSCGGGGGGGKTGFTEALGVGVNMDMVFVGGGTFTMGCTSEQGDDCRDNERPAHLVTLGDFYIGKHEITQRQWMTVMGANNNPSHFKGDDLPVENVSWNDVQTFISRLNSALNKNYRLPTEAEWEYAARGGSRSRGFKYSGSNNADDVAWYYDNSGDGRLDGSNWDAGELLRNNNRTRPVGTKRANELGIHDMSGNVWEWVNDWYGDYTAISKTDPTGPERGSIRVFRGGSWFIVAGYARVSYRSSYDPDFRGSNIGFRLAVSP